MASSLRVLVVFGALAAVLGAGARAFSPLPTPQSSTGFVVLHFMPTGAGESGRACQQAAKTAARGATLFQPVRRADGSVLTITGHVALRFKASTSERQIDSLIAATGVEAFPAGSRASCRRYIVRVVNPEQDPLVIASGLQASGLVDYAIPDASAGRPEGVPGDSFLVDVTALRNSLAKGGAVIEAAPAQYAMGQVLSEYTGPVMRVSGAQLSAALAGVGSGQSALNLVRAHGITTLRVEIPDSAVKVRITLYSLSGTPVRQLVSESLDAGHYLVGWDGMDDRGRRVQPGVYVAVMTAGSFHETRRLVVR